MVVSAHLPSTIELAVNVNKGKPTERTSRRSEVGEKDGRDACRRLLECR